MLFFLIASVFLKSCLVKGQLTVNYKPTTAVINNPERGFYRSTETHSMAYESLDLYDLQSFKSNNFTLILREFLLEDFTNADISASYLNSMKVDFNTVRTAGLKCIVRFAYSDDQNVVNKDASKSRILSHIAQITPILIANEDIIAFFQAGFIGVWGEWYFTNNFGDVSNLKSADYADRKQVAEAILAALPKSRMIQVRTPTLKQKMYSTTTPLSTSQAFDGSSISRIGQHNDCFLASADDYGTYADISKEYPYLQQESRFLPMGGETCAVNKPRSNCPTALNETSMFHWTYLNLDYNPDVINGFINQNCFKLIQNNLGYRFQLISGTFPQLVKKTANGTGFSFTLKILNKGFASLLNKRTVFLIFRNIATNYTCSSILATDPRKWESNVTQTITENITISSIVPAGNYSLFLQLPDLNASLSSRSEYSIRLANANVWETKTGFNSLGLNITITQ